MMRTRLAEFATGGIIKIYCADAQEKPERAPHFAGAINRMSPLLRA